ncbi:membrane hypothetical protein [Capnocytophaga canimorsus]|uniref:Citrate transporter-like domain-containing protein n=1 Tax=Capnocytophaga canimorsus TaxID=28188 RepID=A0A0B7I3N8_9FLAO|nr:membrane hypothetical protein [Capnocytophaga canimorsus]
MSISKFGTAPEKILLGLMLTTAVFSMIMSNTATTAMMVASVAPFLKTLPKESDLSKGILIGIAAAASIGGMGTLIGSPPNAIAVDALADEGIGFLEWMYVGMPVSIILTFVTWYFLKRKYVKTNTPIEVQLEETPTEEEKKEDPRILKMKKNVVLSVLCVTLILWLTEKLHNVPASIISLIPIMLLTMLGVVKGNDVRRLPWDTLMLVAGGLALGMAIKETGLAQHYVDKLQQIHLKFFNVFGVFSFWPLLNRVLLSNVMSNTATATILIPIAIILTYQNPCSTPYCDWVKRLNGFIFAYFNTSECHCIQYRIFATKGFPLCWTYRRVIRSSFNLCPNDARFYGNFIKTNKFNNTRK